MTSRQKWPLASKHLTSMAIHSVIALSPFHTPSSYLEKVTMIINVLVKYIESLLQITYKINMITF